MNDRLDGVNPTPEFVTLDQFTIPGRGTMHVVEVSDDLLNSLDPRTLVDKFVLLDGELQRVTAVEAAAMHWRPGSEAFRHIGLLVRETT